MRPRKCWDTSDSVSRWSSRADKGCRES
jgi:hypothetical protein